MKWLGLIKDPKDLTTKEYVDNADTAVQESTSKALTALDNKKVNSSDIVEYSPTEVSQLWSKHFK